MQGFYSGIMDDEAYPSTQPTQPSEQETQPHSQSQEEQIDPDLYGYLKPIRKDLDRIDLRKDAINTVIGRGSQCTFKLKNPKISSKHCTITWDGEDYATITDTSSNGTFINGKAIGKDKSAVLRDGNEVALGAWRATR